MTNTNAHSVYALPLSVATYPSNKILGKRKRKKDLQCQDDGTDQIAANTEYSAVITPEERAQRRLAGQPLNELPPPAPFPHAPPHPQEGMGGQECSENETSPASLNPGTPSSLRSRHLAVMMAILHTSLEQQDYPRAAKSIALILRTEILGKLVDIRHTGLWGMGAEILLRNHAQNSNHTLSRRRFSQAKVFYDKLALQYPWHRTWPNVVNAQDFKLAMFDLWIYVVHVESKDTHELDFDPDDSLSLARRELRTKRWQLEEADAISKEMDALVNTIPFIDHLELIRLRAMVALWTADLIESVEGLSKETEDGVDFQEPVSFDPWWSNMGQQQHINTQPADGRAVACRTLAQDLFTKLGLADEHTHDAQVEEDHEYIDDFQ